MEELRNFCEFAENNYAKFLQHGNTRFLSLGPSIEKILSMFNGLCAYFLSRKMPCHAEKNFLNPNLKLWQPFARDQMFTFKAYVGLIEKDSISATEEAINIKNLTNHLS